MRVAAQRNMKPMPTGAMCFKEGTDTAQDAMAWYKRIVMGVALNGPTSRRYADALNGGRLKGRDFEFVVAATTREVRVIFIKHSSIERFEKREVEL